MQKTKLFFISFLLVFIFKNTFLFAATAASAAGGLVTEASPPLSYVGFQRETETLATHTQSQIDSLERRHEISLNRLVQSAKGEGWKLSGLEAFLENAKRYLYRGELKIQRNILDTIDCLLPIIRDLIPLEEAFGGRIEAIGSAGWDEYAIKSEKFHSLQSKLRASQNELRRFKEEEWGRFHC